MPPSRIAFAIADLMSEVARLLPRDDIPGIRMVLRADVYAKVGRELSDYNGVQMFNPDKTPSMSFSGIKIEREA